MPMMNSSLLGGLSNAVDRSLAQGGLTPILNVLLVTGDRLVGSVETVYRDGFTLVSRSTPLRTLIPMSAVASISFDPDVTG